MMKNPIIAGLPQEGFNSTETGTEKYDAAASQSLGLTRQTS